MYVLYTEFYPQLQYKLRMWMVKQPKMVVNTMAGKSDSVIAVDNESGIEFNLGYFNDGYLTKYYNFSNFQRNCERLTIAIAHVTKLTAQEMSQRDFCINLTIKLEGRSVVRTLKYERSTIFVSV